MNNNQRVTENTSIELVGVIAAVTDDEPRVVVTSRHDSAALPSGDFGPADHDSLESGFRRIVRDRMGLELYYVEQLYTFGNRYRDPREATGGRESFRSPT